MAEERRIITGKFLHWVIECDGEAHIFTHPEEFRSFLKMNLKAKKYFSVFVPNDKTNAMFRNRQNGYNLEVRPGDNAYRIVNTGGKFSNWLMGVPPITELYSVWT